MSSEEITEAEADAILRVLEESSSSGWPELRSMVEEMQLKDDLCSGLEKLADTANTQNPIPLSEFE